jgi:hypothetical protein
MLILLASRSGRRGEWLPWILLIAGSLAGLAANVAVAEPSLIGRLVAAWPSFAFVGAYELLQGQLRASGRVPPRIEGNPLGGSEHERHVQSADGEDSLMAESPGKRLQRRAWGWALCNRSPEGNLPAGHLIAEAHQRSPRWGRMVRRAGLNGEYNTTEATAARARCWSRRWPP